MEYILNIVGSPVANNDSDINIGVDFSFFSSDSAKKIDAGGTVDETPPSKRKTSKPKVSVNGEVMPSREIKQPANGSVAEVDYSKSYNETNNLIRGTILQADELSNEIKEDIETVRSSKTLKNKYTYLTNLTASASSLLTTKISAIKELNSTITQSHNLELNRLKALKINETSENDDMRMMDLYSAFINTPVGAYANNVPTVQDITLLGNNNITGIDMIPANPNAASSGPLTPEQNRMRLEANPNIQTVVKYNQTTGQRYFDVVDKNTGASVPNYPRPESFLLEDTTIDVHTGIARNRNINTVWPLVLEGNNKLIKEY